VKTLSARLRALAVIGFAVAATSGLATPAPVVRAPAGTPLQAIVDSVAPGTRVRLGPGVHTGPVTIARSLTLEGTVGAVIAAPTGASAALTITADDTHVRALEVQGGSNGIAALRADDLAIDNVAVRNADLHGIHIAGGSARIVGVRISDLRHDFAQGIEVFDAPRSTIEDSSVVGGREGIVTHLSHNVRVEDNRVSGTTFRGIAIKEMSHAWVAENRVRDAAGVGFYCGDMSHCAFSDNHAVGVKPREGGRSSAGWGLVVHFHAVASTDDDVFNGAAGDIATFAESRITPDSPLELGPGLHALWRTLLLTALAVGILVLLYPAGRLVTKRWLVGRLRPELNRGRAISTALVVGLVVQTFHMAEHVVQVFRVRFDGVPSKGSLVGSVVDTEWVHFVYNSAVLGGLAAVLLLRVFGWQPKGRAHFGDALLLVAAAVQSYHVVEHSAKLAQHLVTGAKVNPGFVGGQIDLVWLHFVLNLVVYAGFVGAFVAYHWRSRRADRLLNVSPAPSPG
jgi:parallel beta-helix repeat protein